MKHIYERTTAKFWDKTWLRSIKQYFSNDFISFIFLFQSFNTTFEMPLKETETSKYNSHMMSDILPLTLFFQNINSPSLQKWHKVSLILCWFEKINSLKKYI